MKELKYEIVIEKENDRAAGYSAYCPALPGCFSNGSTVRDTKRNMREAIELFLESLLENGQKIPPPTRAIRVEAVRIAA